MGFAHLGFAHLGFAHLGFPGSSSSSAAEHAISEMSDCHENEDRAGSENGR